MALPDYPFIDVQDYIALDEKASSVRYEYVDGHLRMLAGGSPDHSIIATNIASIFHSALRKTPCTVYNSDIRFKLSEFRYVHPDITVGCDERDRGKKDNIRFPRVIVEVLSPTTETIDKGEKLDMYLDYPTIEEYILVGSQKKMVEVYRRDGDTWVSRRYKSDSIIQLSSIDVSISFEDIYEKTSLF
ncbi:MAG: Uma2 family endonuclease [Ktedonobacteraceae bacterium]|nr:Uma2 family endonuclease [Ktedonobacteraceae bacterium]